jgi:hypothetical protein
MVNVTAQICSSIVKEIKQYQNSGYNTYRGWTQTEYQNKHCNIDRKEEGT